jgi:hypothetical protein
LYAQNAVKKFASNAKKTIMGGGHLVRKTWRKSLKIGPKGTLTFHFAQNVKLKLRK